MSLMRSRIITERARSHTEKGLDAAPDAAHQSLLSAWLVPRPTTLPDPRCVGPEPWHRRMWSVLLSPSNPGSVYTLVPIDVPSGSRVAPFSEFPGLARPYAG